MRKLLVGLILIVIVAAGGVQTNAQGVSSAAVLFLRIAAGARAAGMGEAYVALADDATATHWNPAGLGQYPLNSKWFTVNIPDDLKPLQSVTLFPGEGLSIDIRTYDLWAISPDGLVRLSKSEWQRGDIIGTRGDQTIEAVVREYTGLIGASGDEIIPGLVKEIAEINNEFPIGVIDSLREVVLPHLDSEYSAADEIDSAFAALKLGYYEVHVDWQRFAEARELARKAMRDSVFNETEADRILFLLERAYWRYLPPKITIPFSINFQGQLTDLAAGSDYLWVASDSGLYQYGEESAWRRFGYNEGLPTLMIERIEIFDDRVCLFTDSGLVVYEKGLFTHYGPEAGLPKGNVSAVYFESDDKGWVVVDDDLYRYNAGSWRNYVELTDTAYRSPESIYELMKIYETEAERKAFLEKFKELNSLADESEPAVTDSGQITLDNVDAMIDSLGVISTAEKIDDQSVGVSDLATSTAWKIPFTAGFDFRVNDLAVDNFGTLWVGTNFGLLNFNGRKWRWLGYRDYRPSDSAISVFDLALDRVDGDSTRAGRLEDIIRKSNRLSTDVIEAGQTVKIYSNPAGSRINDIQVMGSRVYFATSSGMIFFDGVWSRLNERDLGKRYSSYVIEREGTLFIATRDKVEIKAAARPELTMMHVNWLPDLADDIYYEFLGYVQNVEGWGTIGANITFLTYGKIVRTDASGRVLGDFSAFDIAFTLSYGTQITSKVAGGISAKVIHSHLSEQGAGREKGSGTSTGIAIDLGLMYNISPRLNMGVAITNLGPEVSYIDVSQSDPLPRNLAIGLAWKVIQTSYNELLFTVEANKSLAERERTILEDFRDIVASPQSELKSIFINPLTVGAWSKAFKNVIINGGIEYKYGSFIAFRAGYIYDEVGDVKTPTLGVGLSVSLFKFDFAYIPSSDEVPLANTMRFSLSVGL
jgi:hypothetical protein